MPYRETIFVVDDDIGTLRGIDRLLRQFGYLNRLFSTAEAFEDYGNFQEALCVILDINLNDNRSGIDLRLDLKAAGYDVPVIYMTGNDYPPARHAAIASGCLAYLTKPFAEQALIEPLNRASLLAATANPSPPSP